MPASFTTRNRFTEQEIGSNENTWGNILNEVLQLVDDSLDGIVSLDVTLGNEILTFLNGDTDEARNRILLITNNSGTSRTVTLPDVQKLYFVRVLNSSGSSTKITNSSDASGVTITEAYKETGILCNGATSALFLSQLDALLQANNLSDLDDKAVSRTNLEVYSKEQVDSGATGGYPVGSIIIWPGSAPPIRHLLCQGQAVSRTIFSGVFSAIGTTYGSGDGATTFNLPDLRGEFVRGLDAGKGSDPSRVLGSAQGDAIRNITGSAGNLARGIPVSTPATGAFVNTFSGSGSVAGGGSSLSIDFDASRVVPTATENRPRNIAMNYAIYTGVI